MALKTDGGGAQRRTRRLENAENMSVVVDDDYVTGWSTPKWAGGDKPSKRRRLRARDSRMVQARATLSGDRIPNQAGLVVCITRVLLPNLTQLGPTGFVIAARDEPVHDPVGLLILKQAHGTVRDSSSIQFRAYAQHQIRILPKCRRRKYYPPRTRA